MLPPAVPTVGSVDRFLSQGHVFADLSDDAQILTHAAFATGRRFFGAEPSERTSSRLPLDAGYRPYGVEYSSAGSHPDEVESFTVSGRSDAADVASLRGAGAALHADMAAVFDALIPSMALAVTALSVSFGVEALPALEASMRRWSILQMNFSRPAATTSEFINDEHEDGCLLTAMVSTGAGLELRTRQGVFESIEPSPSRLLLASGEILSLLTGGRIPPTYHRVRRLDGVKERLSLLLFADLGPELCAPWVVTDLNRGVDIGRRVLTNAARYGLDEWAPP